MNDKTNSFSRTAGRLGWLLLLLLWGGCIQPPPPTVVTSTPTPAASETPAPTSLPTTSPSPTLSPTPLPTPTAATTPQPTSTSTPPSTATSSPTSRPTTATATAVPSTPTPPPPTATPAAGLAILSFRSSADTADPGDTITLSWVTQNAEEVFLHRLLPSGQFGTYWEVDLTGSREMLIDPAARNYVTYMLFAMRGDEHEQATLTVSLTCPDEWFFSPAPDICPARAAVNTWAANQTFEHGRMFWFEELGQIYVIFNDGRSPHWKAYADRWQPGDPLDDPSLVPPPGFYQPVRGFGLLWRTETGLRERLGWGTSSEWGYEAAFQTTSYWKYNEFYFSSADGRVIKLRPEGSGWEFVD